MKKLIFIISLVSLFSSCKKEKVEVNSISDESSNVSVFFDDNFEKMKQKFLVNLSTTNLIKGKSGVVLGIPKNSFETSSGDKVEGEVEIILVEILDFKSMLKSNKTSVSDDKILVSGGQVNIKAYQNNEEHILIKPIVIRIPIENYDSKMALFKGEISNGNLNWKETNDSINIVDVSLSSPFTLLDNLINLDSTFNDVIPSGFFYEFLFDNPKLEWINCDYFYSSSEEKFSVRVNLRGDFNFFNTKRPLQGKK